VARVKESYTGQYLRGVLERDAARRSGLAGKRHAAE